MSPNGDQSQWQQNVNIMLSEVNKVLTGKLHITNEKEIILKKEITQKNFNDPFYTKYICVKNKSVVLSHLDTHSLKNEEKILLTILSIF